MSEPLWGGVTLIEVTKRPKSVTEAASVELQQCHLCGKKRVLRQSHIWPAFAYKRYVSDIPKGGRFVDLFTMTIHNRQYKRPWLCDGCEQTFSDSERPIAALCDRLESDPDASQPYDEHLLRFATSVSWRTLKLNYENKENAAIERLWPAAKLWKQYLRGTRAGISPFTQHIYVNNDNPQGLDKMIGGMVFPPLAFVFSQIGPLLIVGLLDSERLSAGEKIVWRRSQIMGAGGTISPLRAWIMGRGDLENQNVTMPFAAFLDIHQRHLGEKAAARYAAGQQKL
jgi:ribosomal protein L37AE/L43A